MRRACFIGARIIAAFHLIVTQLVAVQSLLCSSAISGEVVGRIVILQGRVYKKNIQNQITPVRLSEVVESRDEISTAANSRVKILLKDESQISLGPESRMRMDQVPSNVGGTGGIGNVSLLTGQVRAKVMKNLLADPNQRPRIKFLLKTKGAVMGVRGTEFQVIYNTQNQITSLVTFEGSVAMAKLEPSLEARLGVKGGGLPDPSSLSRILSNERAVVVTQGNFSSVRPDLPQATIPTKLSPDQFESLKKADPISKAPTNSPSSGTNTASGNQPPSRFLPPIPPGVDPKNFATAETTLGSLASQLGIEGSRSPASIASDPTLIDPSHGLISNSPLSPGATSAPPPEGFMNSKTGAYAPPAGGFLDLKTGLYIPPAVGSAYDPNLGIYVPPASLGKIDPKTGDYVAPAGFKLDPSRGFVPEHSSPQTSPSTSQSLKVPPSIQNSAATQKTGSSASESSAPKDFLPLPGINSAAPGVGFYSPAATLLGNSPGGWLSNLGGTQNSILFPNRTPATIASETTLLPPPAYIPQGPTTTDPYCPNCPPPQPPPPPPNSTITKVRFLFNVQ